MNADTLWVIGRATGVMSLVLLSVVTALGVATTRHRPPAGLSGYAVAAVHRNVSLLAVVFLLVHVLTLLADPEAGLSWIALVVPLTAARDPVWFGLGPVALDLLIAVVVTSVLRTRLSLRAWRGVHRVAYACWPVALAHGLGGGTDASTPWMLGLVAASVGLVLAAVAVRIRSVRIRPVVVS